MEFLVINVPWEVLSQRQSAYLAYSLETLSKVTSVRHVPRIASNVIRKQVSACNAQPPSPYEYKAFAVAQVRHSMIPLSMSVELVWLTVIPVLIRTNVWSATLDLS